jgi:alpha-1,2-mannosyltransferase
VSGTGAVASVAAPGLRAAARRVIPVVVFGIVPLAAVCLLLSDSLEMTSRLAFWDFHALWNAGHDVLHGQDPYPPASRQVLRSEQAFVYPAPAAVAAAPFALVPFKASGVLFQLLSIAALLLALRIAGIRDWRCYGLAFLYRPVLHALALGAVSPLLALGLAITWRWRDRRWVAGGAVAALILLKVFLWPVAVWLAFTRRWIAFAITVGLTVLVALASWAVIGFAGLRAYPHILAQLSRLLEGKSYSLVALGLALGASVAAARAVAVLVGVACLAVIAWPGRAGTNDAWTFTFALAAALAFSPIVWLHYFALLLVPLAIVRPRLGPLWLLPLAFWAIGGQSTDPAIWERGWSTSPNLASAPVGRTALIAYAVVVAAGVLIALAYRARPTAPA